MRRIVLGSATLLALCLGSLAIAADKDEAKPVKKPVGQETMRRPSDVVFVLIETSGHDEGSAAEIQRLYDVLRKLDKNNDGKIDAGALREAREQIIEDRVDYLMKELDADNDGKISRDEAKGRIKEHFDRIDRDKDGFITKAELRHAIIAHHKTQVAPPKD